MDDEFDSIDIMSIKDKKIKYIYSFFEKKYSDEISNKILTIINNYNIEYTVNKNGIFINLNVIDDEIIDLIYDCIMSSTKCINNSTKNLIKMNTSVKDVKSEIEDFIYGTDTINYTDVDISYLELSRRVLTI
jgi:hypothetical protein